jgi:hypothetical protein
MESVVSYISLRFVVRYPEALSSEDARQAAPEERPVVGQQKAI